MCLLYYFCFLLLLIAFFCFFFLLTLGFSYSSCLRRSPMIPSFWHFLLNLLIALSIGSVSPTLIVDITFSPTYFKFLFYYMYILDKVKYFIKNSQILDIFHLKYVHECEVQSVLHHHLD